MSLAEQQAKMIEELNFLPDAQERLAEVVRRGARQQLPEVMKTDGWRVEGCIFNATRRARW